MRRAFQFAVKVFYGTVHISNTHLLQRLTQAGFLRAFSRPGFFLSTRLASDVTQPAANELASGKKGKERIKTRLCAVLVLEQAHGPAKLLLRPE